MQHPKIIIGTSKYRNYNIKYVRKLHSATSSTSQINHCNIQKILLQHHAAGPRRAQISGRRSRAHPWPQAPSPPRSSCGRGSHGARRLPRAPPRWSSSGRASHAAASTSRGRTSQCRRPRDPAVGSHAPPSRSSWAASSAAAAEHSRPGLARRCPAAPGWPPARAHRHPRAPVATLAPPRLRGGSRARQQLRRH